MEVVSTGCMVQAGHRNIVEIEAGARQGVVHLEKLGCLGLVCGEGGV